MKAVVSAVLVVVFVVGATAASAAAPPQLVGTWTRTPTEADVAKANATINAGSPWTLIVRRNGSAVISGSAATFSGRIISAGEHRVRININTPPSDVYTWRASAKTLTFTKVRDTDRDRLAVFNGVWRRKG